MTSDTRDLRSTEQPPTPPPDRVQLSAVQVAASALASVSAAVVASLFGVTGTVVGAGLVAILSTTGSAIYSSSMKHTSDQLRRAREQLLTARVGENRSGTTRSSTAVLDRPERLLGRRSQSPGTPPPGSQTPRSSFGDEAATLPPAGTSAAAESSGSRWRRGLLTVGSRRGLKWPALIGAAVLVFAIAIGVVTAFEALAQKPISSLTGHQSSSSTTLGSLTGGKKATPTPTPSASRTDSGTDATTTPSAQPSASRSGSGSSATATTSASPKPTHTASSAPASSKPSSGSGGGAGGTGSSGSTSGTSGSGGEVQVPVP
jgi:hypothetical protein